MLFNSYIFLFAFLPVALAGWWLLKRDGERFLFLTLMSYVFYGWWDWRFIPLMILSTTADFVAGARIAATEDEKVRRLWLTASLSFNLAILAFFKYYGFFADSVNVAASRFGISPVVPVVQILLPIGISFYTFNSMSYTIDVYRRRVAPAKGVLQFSAFVAMFPHLIAGPIVRYADIEHQFDRLRVRLSSEEAARGIFFFVIGLSKKLLIADQLAPWVNEGFTHAGGTAGTAWFLALGYTFQLYFDFSGYSDMAVGLAHFLGITFPQNFNSPYKASDISDFWRRWHISLSTWLRDYLFIPLGGSRAGPWKTLRNLAITMFLGGLWHGAQWTFVVWGLYHGVLLAIHAGLRRATWLTPQRVIGQFVTFVAVVFGWVLFRAPTLRDALQMWSAMLGLRDLRLGPLPDPPYLMTLTVAAVIAFAAPNTWQINFRPRVVYAYGLAIAFVVCVLLLQRPSPFLYFQF